MSLNEKFILAIFIAISCAMLLLITKRSSVSSDFYFRVKSWFWMLFILLISVFLSSVFMPLLIAFVVMTCMFEITSVSRLNKVESVGFLLSVMIIIITSLISNELMLWNVFLIAIFLITVLLVTFFHFNNKKKNKEQTLTLPVLIIFILHCIFTMSVMYLINNNDKNTAISYLLYLIFTTQFSDVFQYLGGKKFGKHKLSPLISPNKTIEGAISGVLTMTFSGMVVAFYLMGFTIKEGMLISFCVTTAGVIGDLFVSWFKRKMAIKDMGTLIPGHGGMMDRIDSLLLSTPIFLIMVECLINIE